MPQSSARCIFAVRDLADVASHPAHTTFCRRIAYWGMRSPLTAGTAVLRSRTSLGGARMEPR